MGPLYLAQRFLGTMSKQKIFSVTIKDCAVKEGPDHVQVKHGPSASIGRGEDRGEAFKEMTQTKTFRVWCRRRAMAKKVKVAEVMAPDNLKVEYYKS